MYEGRVIDSIKTIPSSFFTYIGTQEEGNTTDKNSFVVDLNFHFARFGVQYSIFSDGNLNHSKSHWIPPQTVLSFCVRSLNILLLYHSWHWKCRETRSKARILYTQHWRHTSSIIVVSGRTGQWASIYKRVLNNYHLGCRLHVLPGAI